MLQVSDAIRQHAISDPVTVAATVAAGCESHLEMRCWFDGTSGGGVGLGMVEVHPAPIKTVAVAACIKLFTI